MNVIAYMYAMDENKMLYKLFSEEFYERDDETYMSETYQIANGSFVHAWDCEDGECLFGQVALWPLPEGWEFEEFLKLGFRPSVCRLLRANNIEPLESKIIGFFWFGKSYENYDEDNSRLFSDKFTLSGRIEDEEQDLQLADLVLKEGIEAITDEELERLYQSFLSTDQPF